MTDREGVVFDDFAEKTRWPTDPFYLNFWVLHEMAFLTKIWKSALLGKIGFLDLFWGEIFSRKGVWFFRKRRFWKTEKNDEISDL